MQVAFYLAGEITQVKEAIPWVRCASGNVSSSPHAQGTTWALATQPLFGSGNTGGVFGISESVFGIWDCEFGEIDIWSKTPEWVVR